MGKRKAEDEEEKVEAAGEEVKVEVEDPALDNDEGEPTEHKVSVGSLAFTTKRKAVRKVFAKFGTVVTVRRYVKACPRRADLSYESKEEMQAAIDGMNGKELDGRVLKVRLTPPPEVAAVAVKKGKGRQRS